MFISELAWILANWKKQFFTKGKKLFVLACVLDLAHSLSPTLRRKTPRSSEKTKFFQTKIISYNFLW